MIHSQSMRTDLAASFGINDTSELLEHIQLNKNIVIELSDVCQIPPVNVVATVTKLIADNASLQHEITSLQKKINLLQDEILGSTKMTPTRDTCCTPSRKADPTGEPALQLLSPALQWAEAR